MNTVQKPNRFKWGLKEGVIASFIFHFILLNVYFSQYSMPKMSENSQKKISPLKILLKQKIESKVKKQIVNTRENEKKLLNKKAVFLSQKTTSFEKQQKARNIGKFQVGGLGVKTLNKRKVLKKISQLKKKRKKITDKNFTLSDLGFYVSKEKSFKKLSEKNLRPQLRQGDVKSSLRNPAVSRSRDFLEDIPLGNVAQLNSAEYQFFGFYNRIRLKLEQYWGHSLKQQIEKIMKSGRRPAAQANHVTSLQVIMDHKGKIMKVIVKGSSGINEFDQAAIEAFNEAGPFPNPPAGMIKGGKAIVEWGFVVKV